MRCLVDPNRIVAAKFVGGADTDKSNRMLDQVKRIPTVNGELK